LTVQAYREAARKQAEAEGQREFARQTVDDMCSAVALEWFEFDAKRFPVQEKFLNRALAFYQEFAQERPDDPAARFQLAQAFRRVADAQQGLGHPEKALRGYEQALGQLAQVDESEAARLERAFCHINRGILLQNSGRWPQAAGAFRDGIALLRQLRADHPAERAYREGLVVGLINRAGIRQDTGQLSGAETDMREALTQLTRLLARRPKHPPYLFRQATVQSNYAGLLQQLGRSDEAEVAIRKVVESARTLVKTYPNQRHFQALSSSSLGNLARLLRETGRLAEAEKAVREALPIGAKLAEDFPTVPEYQEVQAAHFVLLGELLGRLQRWPAAEDNIRTGIAILQKRLTANPRATPAKFRLATARKLVGEVLRESGRATAARTDLTEAVRLFTELSIAVPQNLGHHSELAVSCFALAEANEACGQYSGAARSWRQANGVLARLTEKVPRVTGGHVPAWLDEMRYQGYNRLAVASERQGDYPAALTASRQAGQVAERLARSFPHVPKYYLGWGVENANLARLLILAGRTREAITPGEAAAGRLGDLVRKHPLDEVVLSEAARANGVLGALYLRLGQAKQAEANFREQRRLLEQMVRWSGTTRGRAQLAWLLANCPLHSERDPATAVGLAEQVRKSPEGNSPSDRLMLAAAYHRVGRYRDAVGLLEPLAKQAADGSIEVWAHLALAQYRHGQKEKAIEQLRRAARWVRSHPHLDLQGQFLLEEVNDLLGNPEPSLKLAPLPAAEKLPPATK
jgi:tetratricopeptide (TPR) repeat protein